MRLSFLFLSLLLMFAYASAQNESRVITTAVPFLTIASDARSGGMGELGVTTSPDVFSQQWNPAKYAFTEREYGVGLSYTPYLSQLVNDIALLNASFYSRINERSTWAATIRYFGLGDIEFITENEAQMGVAPTIVRPNELSLDASYSLKLSETFSMAVAGRFIRSDLKYQDETTDGTSASTFAVDVAGFYRSHEIVYNSFNGVWKGGFNISNIGPKMKYDEDDSRESPLPTNLKFGAGFDFIFDPKNTLSLNTEFNKLLVPTPSDSNGDGEINTQDDYYKGSFFSGMFTSFGDAPDGFSEELKEVTWTFGVEYVYNKAFALRTGYFHENDEKGARKFFTLGAGFTFKATTIDLSYLFSTSNVRNPLENTLRFSLTFNLGEEY